MTTCGLINIKISHQIISEWYTTSSIHSSTLHKVSEQTLNTGKKYFSSLSLFKGNVALIIQNLAVIDILRKFSGKYKFNVHMDIKSNMAEKL